MVFAIGNLPLMTNSSIIHTSPFWTSILAYYINKESLKKVELLCMCGCFSGVIILAHSSQKPDENSTGLAKDKSPMFGMINAILCAWFYSGVIVSTRKLKEIHFSLMLFHYGIIASSLYLVYIVVQYGAKIVISYPNLLNLDPFYLFHYNTQQWSYLLIISLLNSIA
jgi:drug/metabolite transporter (DMT)-like permease